MTEWKCAAFKGCVNFAALPFRFRQLKQLVKLTVGVGGSRLRLRLSNRYGQAALTFDRIMVADNPAMEQAVTVAEQVVLPAGQCQFSAAVDFPLTAGQAIYVTMVASQPQSYADFASTYDPQEVNACYSQSVNAHLHLPHGDHARKGWFCLEGVDVWTAAAPLMVEITGDSLGEMGMVASALARQLRQTVEYPVVIINTAISGSRLLHDAPRDEPLYQTFGRSLLHRQSRSTWRSDLTVALVGSNDLVLPFWSHEACLPTVAQLLHGVDQLAALVDQAGGQLVMPTVPPFDLHLPATQAATTRHLQAVRQQFNQQLLNRSFVVNVEPLIATGEYLTPAADFGDQLHYSRSGANLVARAILAKIDDRMCLLMNTGKREPEDERNE